jgi:hypothetical protein
MRTGNLVVRCLGSIVPKQSAWPRPAEAGHEHAQTGVGFARRRRPCDEAVILRDVGIQRLAHFWPEASAMPTR